MATAVAAALALAHCGGGDEDEGEPTGHAHELDGGVTGPGADGGHLPDAGRSGSWIRAEVAPAAGANIGAAAYDVSGNMLASSVLIGAVRWTTVSSLDVPSSRSLVVQLRGDLTAGATFACEPSLFDFEAGKALVTYNEAAAAGLARNWVCTAGQVTLTSVKGFDVAFSGASLTLGPNTSVTDNGAAGTSGMTLEGQVLGVQGM